MESQHISSGIRGSTDGGSTGSVSSDTDYSVGDTVGSIALEQGYNFSLFYIDNFKVYQTWR